MPLVDVTSAPNEPPSSSAVWKASWNCGMFPVGTGTMLSFVSGERWGDETRAGLPPASGDKLLKRWLVRHHHCGRQQHLRASSSPLLLLGELVAVTPQRAIPLKTSPTQMMDLQKVLFPVQSHSHQGTAMTSTQQLSVLSYGSLP